MCNVKVGRKVEILNVETFNDNVVKVGDVATIFSIEGSKVYLRGDDWEFSQLASLSQEGEAWKLVSNKVEAPTINSEPFITIKGVEAGSSLERALNLVVAVYNGDSVRERCYEHYGCTNEVHYSYEYTRYVVDKLDTKGLDWYILKSEDEAKLNKEALDKEIKELEDKLQELKNKRVD